MAWLCARYGVVPPDGKAWARRTRLIDVISGEPRTEAHRARLAAEFNDHWAAVVHRVVGMERCLAEGLAEKGHFHDRQHVEAVRALTAATQALHDFGESWDRWVEAEGGEWARRLREEQGSTIAAAEPQRTTRRVLAYVEAMGVKPTAPDVALAAIAIRAEPPCREASLFRGFAEKWRKRLAAHARKSGNR